MKKKIKRAVATGMSLAMGTVIMTSDVMVSPVMASQINGEKPYAVELYAASNASYNGLYYSTSGSYATITGYDGQSTDIVIPEKIGSYTVNTIEYGAFKDNNKITSVKIPSTVTQIGNSYGSGAFENCANLKSVSIAAGAETAYIGNAAFKDCTSLEEITVPGNYTTIYSDAFRGCRSLKKFVYNDNGISRKIQNRAFYECTSLVSLSLPTSLNSIGDEAFSGCSSLTAVDIPEGVKLIEYGVFNNCKLLKKVVIPSTIQRIGNSYNTGAFQNCTSLSTVTIKEGSQAATIGSNTFSGCSAITSIVIPGNYSKVMDSAFKECKGLKTLTYSPSINGITHKIGSYAFENCQSLAQVTLGTGLESIDTKAFYNDSMITEVNIPVGVKSIGQEAFSNCTRLSKLTLPEGLTVIKSGAFASCKSLKSVVIPSTVTRVTDSYVAGAFENCTGLTSVTFKEGIAEAVIGQDSFNGCQSLLSVIIPGNYGKIGDSAFRNCTSLKSFKYAQSVNNIEHTVGSSAFRDCKSLTSITLEKGLKTIDSYAFCNTNVDKLDVPEGVTQIAAASFMDCKNLVSVNIPSTVSSIGGAYYGGAFESCAKLTAVNIAGNKNIEASIGYSAFKDCVMLKNIVIPGNYNSIGEYAFSGCSSLTGFEYKKSSYDFANQNIGSHAFYQCIKLNDVKLPTTLGTIGSYAFYGCSVLQKAVIPEGVKTIGNNSFEGCKALETVTVPSTVESISRACFEGCTRLKNVIIAKGDTDAKISSYAFQDCTSLTDISVPGNYVNVDSYAFSGCTNLSKFSWEKGMYGYNNQSLSGYVFDNNNNLSVVSLPSTLGTIDKNSFYNVKSTFVIEGETGSEAESYAKTKGITFRKYSQPLSINAVISPSGSAKDGDVINIQANASGGSLDYLYKLVVYNEDTGKWGIVRDYGETSGFTWASSTGNRKFYVKVKDSTGKEVLSPALISINKKLEAKASYKYVNNNIEFTALANYGSGNYQYKFIVYNVDTGKWGIIQDYSSKNTCVWNASGASAGNRKFYVDIKDSSGTVARSAAMNVSTQTGLNVSLKSSAAQVNPGASVKLTANATGGNGSYQYKFIVYNTATKQWGKVQDYSSSNTCTWIAGAAGTRQFYVDVKDASGKVVRSAVNTVNVGNGMSVTATISTNANKIGGKVTISGAATGGAGSYQYKFIVYNKTTKTWGLVQNFSTNNKITWTAGSAGDREFYIDVKDANGKVVRSSVMNVKTTK